MTEEGAAVGQTNGVKARRDLALIGALSLSMVSTAILAGMSWVGAPAQWDAVNKVIDGLQAMNLLLAGGLLGVQRKA